MPPRHVIPIVARLDELRTAVPLDLTLVDRIADAFKALSDGNVAMPPTLYLDIPFANAEVDAKAAYVRGLPGFSIKISPTFFDNSKHGLPSTSGLMIVLDAATGRVRSILLDEGYLTDIRTAAAGAVAARELAREGPVTAGVIGTGRQARLQMHALTLVRPVARITVWGRDSSKAPSLARLLEHELGVPAEPVETAEDAVRAADFVVTTTRTREPVVEAAWLHEGLHITAIGSDVSGKRELGAGVVEASDLVFCDRRGQSMHEGELQYVSPEQAARAAELGDVLTGRALGRTSARHVTVCDLTGTGVQDTFVAVLAEQRIRDHGGGLLIE